MNSNALAAAAATAVLISTVPILGKDITTYPDKIVTTNKASFLGGHDGWVQLTVNGVKSPAVVTKNKPWTITVQLNPGVNLIKGTTSRQSSGKTIDGEIPEFVWEFKSDLKPLGNQKVFLDWSDAGTDDILKDIARLSLRPPLSVAQLDNFAKQVKSGVRNFVGTAYSGVKISFVDSGGNDVRTIKFLGNSHKVCDLYGKNQGQSTEVYLNTFKGDIISTACNPNAQAKSALLLDTPAKVTDSLAQRAADIATFIGRTAAHEFGHSLGLVEKGENKLHGCRKRHNCPEYRNGSRFDWGHNIMDPGEASKLFARIGQANRTGPRQSLTPKFNDYNLSYLKIIH